MDSCVTRKRVVASERDRRVRRLGFRLGAPVAVVAAEAGGVGSSRRMRSRGTDSKASTDEEDDDEGASEAGEDAPPSILFPLKNEQWARRRSCRHHGGEVRRVLCCRVRDMMWFVGDR